MHILQTYPHFYGGNTNRGEVMCGVKILYFGALNKNYSDSKKDMLPVQNLNDPKSRLFFFFYNYNQNSHNKTPQTCTVKTIPRLFYKPHQNEWECNWANGHNLFSSLNIASLFSIGSEKHSEKHSKNKAHISQSDRPALTRFETTRFRRYTIRFAVKEKQNWSKQK